MLDRQVRKNLAALVALGEVERIESPGKPNRYRIATPVFQDSPVLRDSPVFHDREPLSSRTATPVFQDSQNTKEHQENTKRARTAPKAEAVELPDALDCEVFRKAWDDWFAYRRERRLPAWTARTIKAQLAKLESYGLDGAPASRKALPTGIRAYSNPKPTRWPRLASIMRAT